MHKLKAIFQEQNRALRHNQIGFGDDQGPQIVDYPKLPAEEDPVFSAAGGERAYFAAVFK